MTPSIWNCFHDGDILSMSGVIPGEIRLVIECQCVREELEQPGDLFLLRLLDCRELSYKGFGMDTVITDPEALNGIKLEIFGGEMEGATLVVHLIEGVMRLEYETEVVELDGGYRVTAQELYDAANRSVEGG
jgi:hypothetical protein